MTTQITESFKEIKRLRERVELKDATSIHLLGVRYMDDYADVCMKAMLNSLCVAFYKMAKDFLDKMDDHKISCSIEEFRESPNIKKIGGIEAMIVQNASEKGKEFQRAIHRAFSRVFCIIANNIDEIATDKWGKTFLKSHSLISSFDEFRANPKFLTLLSSLNVFAKNIKGIDFRDEGIAMLKENSENEYLPSKLVLDCLNESISLPPSEPEVTTFIPALPNILYISFSNNPHNISDGGNISLFEYGELTNDIFKEICFIFSEHIGTDDIPLDIIRDFSIEEPIAYKELMRQIDVISDRLISDIDIDEILDINFPEEYIKWLLYHNNISFKNIGEQLYKGNLKVRLSLSDMYREYINSKIRRYISEKMKEKPEIEGFSIIGNNIKESAFINTVKIVKPGIVYYRWDSPENYYIIANSYLTGIGICRDIQSGLNCLRKAAEGDYAPAQYQLGIFYKTGSNVETDRSMAYNLFELASNQSFPNAQYELGKMILEENDSKIMEYETALKLFEKAEAQDYEKARIALAKCHLYGEGTAQSDERFAEYTKKFSNSSDGEALYLLAEALYRGIGMPQNIDSAIEIYKKSADVGEAKAQLILGDIYAEGSHVSKNIEVAALWYKKAADKNNCSAQYAMVKIGKILNNDSLCVEYFIQASENGCKEILNDDTKRFFPYELIEKWESKIQN